MLIHVYSRLIHLDEDMDGSPCFLEPLVNVTIKEGSKFRIACSIAGFPQPKVIWYHNKGKCKMKIRRDQVDHPGSSSYFHHG